MSADQSGRHPITIVELDQDFCTLTYGVGACPAQLSPRQPHKCFNTRRTCQAPQAYDAGVLPLRFTFANSATPRDGNTYIPSLLSVSSRPMRINPGHGLGTRASVKLTFLDHLYDDFQVDKYRADRDYDPMERGTFWTKWIARNPYYQNRPIRVLHGYEGQPLSEFRVRHYFMDKVEGPDARNIVTITAKDVLKLADDDRALAPRPTQVVLRNDVSASDTGFLVEALFGTSVNAELPSQGYLRIGKEVMYMHTRNGGAVYVNRAQFYTEAEDHEAGDTVQLCLHYEQVPVQDITYDLLVNYGGVPPQYVDKNQWDQEAGVWQSGYNLTTLITEPIGVNQLITELTEQCLFFIWWDEEEQTIPYTVLRPPDDEPVALNDSEHLVKGSVVRADNPSERISQVIIYYNQMNPVEKLDETSNYTRVRIRRDVEAESDDQYGEPRIRSIYSRWYDHRNDGQTLSTGARLLNAYRDNPVIVKFSLDAKDREAVKVGDTVDMISRYVVGYTGEPTRIRLLALSSDEVEHGHRIEFELQNYRIADVRLTRITPNGWPLYSDATEQQRRRGGFITRNDGTMLDGSPGYQIV